MNIIWTESSYIAAEIPDRKALVTSDNTYSLLDS